MARATTFTSTTGAQSFFNQLAKRPCERKSICSYGIRVFCIYANHVGLWWNGEKLASNKHTFMWISSIDGNTMTWTTGNGWSQSHARQVSEETTQPVGRSVGRVWNEWRKLLFAVTTCLSGFIGALRSHWTQICRTAANQTGQICIRWDVWCVCVCVGCKATSASTTTSGSQPQYNTQTHTAFTKTLKRTDTLTVIYVSY